MKPRIALALSGGGFRASLFHLGVMKRLAAVIVEPFRKIVEEGNFLLQWLQGCWRWPFRKLVDRGFSRTQAAAELLGVMFFGGAECGDLPDKPLLILNATSLQSMRAWRFTKWGLGDWRIGHASWGKRSLPLGVCVGASAAFPPVFPPAWIRRDHYSFSGPVYNESSLPPYHFVPLTDGGVYDNMGLEAVIKPTKIPAMTDAIEPAEFLIVSDGGAPANLHLRSSGLPAIGEALLLYRVDEIVREQVTALRTRAIVGELFERKRQGLFVSLRSDVGRIGDDSYKKYYERVDPQCLVPGAVVEMIRTIRTSLDRFDPVESAALMYHAYMMTDAFLWCYRDTFATDFRIGDAQLPTWPVRFTPDLVQEWAQKLVRSASIYKLR